MESDRVRRKKKQIIHLKNKEKRRPAQIEAEKSYLDVLQSKLPTATTTTTTNITNITNKRKNKRNKSKRKRNRVIENSKVDSDTDTDVSLPEIELDEVTSNNVEVLVDSDDLFDDLGSYGSDSTSEFNTINSDNRKQTSTTTTNESKGKEEMNSEEEEIDYESDNNNGNGDNEVQIEEIDYNIDNMNVYGSLESRSVVDDGSGPSGSGWGCDLFRESELEAKCFAERAAQDGERREKFAIGKRKLYLSEIGKLNVFNIS